jgi:hypothetical protein
MCRLVVPLRRIHFPDEEGVPLASREKHDVRTYSNIPSLVHDNGLQSKMR